VSERHLQTIRTGHQAFNRGEASWADELVAKDAEWRPTGEFPGMEGVYRGPEAMRHWMDTIRAEWEEFEVSLAEVLREGGDAVLVVERLWGRGRESGAEAEMRIFSVYRFNADGKIAQRLAYTTQDEALAVF
jgi:ketosteroid isomerase-like protein